MNKVMQNIWLIFGLSFSSLSFACLLHPSIDASRTVPTGSVWVNIQSQLALQEGTLVPTQLQDGDNGYRQVSWWLRLLADKHRQDLTKDTYVYVADIALWVKFPKLLESSIMLEEEPQNEEAPVLLISRQSLNAVVSSAMTLEEAFELGVAEFRSRS